MAEIVISSGVVSSGINVGEDTQLIVEAGGTVIDTVASSFDCGPIFVETGGLAVSTVIEDGAELWISGTANNTTATDLGSAILFVGGVANNTMVEDQGTLEISGGVAVSTTVETEGTVYIYGGIASNTIVIDGYLVVYEEGFADTALIGSDGEIDVYGSAADITVNGGEMFIDDGSVVNGLTASSATMIYVDFGGKLTGQITLDSSPVTLTSDAVLDFDISAQAPGSAALLNDYSQVGAESGSVFTITVDANQTEGSYALAGGVTMFGGSLTVGTTDTAYGSVDLDDPLVYGDYTYTLTLTEGALDLTIAEGGGDVPTSSGAIISDGAYAVSSGEFWLDTTINSSGTLTVSNGGRADSTTVNLNGWLNVYPEGTATAIVENGGWVNLDDGASATFASNTFSGITFESAQATIHSGTTAVDITLNEWGVIQVFDGGVVDSVTVNPGGGLTLRSGTALNIIENGGSVQTDLVPGASATMTFLPNTFSGAVVDNGRFITAHSGTTAVDVTASGYGSMEVYSGGVLRGLTVGSTGRAVIQPGGKLTGSVTLDSNLEQMILAQNAILDFDISAQSPNSTPLLNDYSLISIWGSASPIYTVTVDAAQAVGTYALAGGAAAFEGSLTVGTTDTEYGSVTVNGDALVYGDYTYTLTLTEGALDLTIAEGGGEVISGVVIPDEEHGIVSSGVTWLDTTIQYGAWFDVKAGGFASSTLIGGDMDVFAGGSADIATVNPNGILRVSSGATVTNITENGGAVTLVESGSATFVPNTFSGVTVQFFATATVHSGTTAVDTTIQHGGNMEVFDGGVASNVNMSGSTFDAKLNVHSGGKVTGSLVIDSSNAVVTMEEGSVLDFDVSAQASGADPLVNDLSLVGGSPTYTITVSSEQAGGVYALAGGADGFAATVTLGAADTAYGTITVNGDALVYGDYTFYLTLNSGELSLYVNEEPPAPPISGMVLINSTFVVSPGVSVLDTQVSSGGVLEVLDYGLADSTSVNPNGSMCVYSGGTATEIVENGGYVGIYNGASATFVPTVLSGLIIENGGKTTLHSATEALDATVNSTGFLQVCDGGLVSGLAVTSGGGGYVFSGGKVTGSMTFSQATEALYLFSGSILDFDISEEAPGSDPLLNDYSGLAVSEGAIFTITVDAAQADGVYALAGGADGFAATVTLGTADTAYGTITVNGDALVYGDYTFYLTLDSDALSLYVNEEPVPPAPSITGVTVYSSGEVVSSAAEMTSETLQAGANDWMTVGEGGIATSTAVNPGGIMDVYSGGLATITTIDADNNHSATVNVYSGGTADFTTINYEADLQVLDGGVANNTTANQDGGLIVSSGGVANDTTLNQGGRISVEGTANGITAVAGARVTIRNGGVANDITFNGGGSLAAYGGVANGITAGSGTWVDIRSAAKVTGSMTLETGAQFNVSSGGILDFDVSEQAPGAGVLVNDLSLIGGSPSYTITVDAAQANGAYALAGEAGGFTATVTLGTADTEYGTITVNGDALVYGDYTYYLTLNSGELSLYVNEEPPEPVIPRTELLGNGHSQILAWDGSAGKVGYRATDGNPSPAWCGVWEWGTDASNWRVEASGHFAGSTTDKDGILLYDKTAQALAAWTDLGDSTYGYVSLCSIDESFSVRCLGDFDGNGFDDVVVCSTDGSVGIVSDGTDYHDVWHMVPEVPSIMAWSLIGGGRFSSTLDQDSLLFRNKDDGHLYLWDNQGAALADWGWQRHDIGLLEDGWDVAAIGDFAGDGIEDIVLVNHNENDAVYIWDDGDSATQHYVGTLMADIEAVGDYDGDGKEDLLLREYDSGWGGLGYWAGGDCSGWTDLNASIETDQNNKFVIVA